MTPHSTHEVLERIQDRLGSIDVTLAAQHKTLEEHMRRTELLEKDIAPLKAAHLMWSGAGKVLAICGTLATILGVALRLLKLI